MSIAKGKIGNALTSTASDHIVAVAEDVFDEGAGKYQSEMNADYESRITSAHSKADANAEKIEQLLSKQEDQEGTNADYESRITSAQAKADSNESQISQLAAQQSIATQGGSLPVCTNLNGTIEAGSIPTAQAVKDADEKIVGDITQLAQNTANAAICADQSEDSPVSSDLDVSDEDGNVIVSFANGHIKTKNFDSSSIKTDIDVNDGEKQDLDISDEEGNVIVSFEDGHIRTKEFDSRSIKTDVSVKDNETGDLDISDEEGNVIVSFSGGNIKTKYFDSSKGIDDSQLQTIINETKKVVVSDSKPRGVIFDTDWWTDVDDAVAVRVLLWAERCGMIDLVGVCIDAVSPTSVLSLDRFINYEGRHNVCIGIDKQATDYDGTSPYHNTCINNWSYGSGQTNDNCEDCVTFYRRALSSIPDGEQIDIISVGYPNAISRLLDSTPDSYSSLTGIDLVKSKVRYLWMMAGSFPSGSENNFKRTSRSRTAGANVCDKFPCPIYFLGYEAGVSVLAGGGLQNTIVGTDDLLYKCLEAHGSGEGTNGRSAWDPMTTLMACIGDAELAGYNITRGNNVVNPSTGSNTFTTSPTGNHYYVTKRYSDNWYKQQINTICMKSAWPMRKLGRLQLQIK